MTTELCLVTCGTYVEQELEAEFAQMPPTLPPVGTRRLFEYQLERIGPDATGDIVEEVEALCQAINMGGPGEVESTRREFLARNWGVVTVIDKLAHARFSAAGRHAQRLERALPPDIVARLDLEERYTDAFERAYPETFKQLFGQTDVDAASLLDMLEGFDRDIVAVETESEGAIWRLMPGFVRANMLKVYYNFARIEALVQEREASLGIMHSHVVLSRPDCEIASPSAAHPSACLKRADLAWSSFADENTLVTM
jgi:hypothetical protein